MYTLGNIVSVECGGAYMPVVLKQHLKAEKNLTLNVCDLFLHRGNSAYSTIENLFHLLSKSKRKVDTNSHKLSTIQLTEVLSEKLLANAPGVTLRRELVALFAVYSSEPARHGDSLMSRLLSSCIDNLSAGAKILPVHFTAPSKYFSFEIFAAPSKDGVSEWGESELAGRGGSSVDIKESSLFHIVESDGIVVDRIQVSVSYSIRYSKKKVQSPSDRLLCICDPKMTVSVVGLDNEVGTHHASTEGKSGKVELPTRTYDVGKICEKFYVGASGPVFPGDKGDTFVGDVLRLNLDFLAKRVFGKLDVSPTYFAIHLFSMLASVASEEISIRNAFTKCTKKHEAATETEVVESRFIFAMPNLLYAVCLKYDTGIAHSKSKNEVSTKERIENVEIMTHKCERLERDIRSWVRFHVCDLPDLEFKKFSLAHTFEVSSKKIVGKHFSSEYEDRLVAPLVEDVSGDVEYCTVVHANASSEGLALDILGEEAAKTIALLKARGLGILEEKGVNSEAMAHLITRSLRNSNTLDARLIYSTGLVLLKHTGHYICFSRTMEMGASASEEEVTEKRNCNDIEEHFIYEVQGVEKSYVHVCANYGVGNYHYRYGRYRAFLNDLALYVRVAMNGDLKGNLEELPDLLSLRNFMMYVADSAGKVVEVDCERFKSAMSCIQKVVSNAGAITASALPQGKFAKVPDIDLVSLLREVGHNYYVNKLDKSPEGILDIIGDPIIRYDHVSVAEGSLQYLNSLLETNTGRDNYVKRAGTCSSSLFYNLVRGGTSENVEVIKDRIKVLQRLKSSTSGRLHASVLEAIANITTSGRSSDFIRHLTSETQKKVGLIDLRGDAWYAVHITGISLDVSHNLEDDGTGTIDLAHNYALAYGAWWSHKVAHFSISCTIDVSRNSKGVLYLKFHDVRVGIMADHMKSEVLKSGYRITNEGHSSFTKAMSSGQSMFNARRFSLIFSEHDILACTEKLGYRHLINSLEDEASLGGTASIREQSGRTHLLGAPVSEDVESGLARIIVKFINAHGADGILSTIPVTSSGMKIKAVCYDCTPTYMRDDDDEVEQNIDLTQDLAVYAEPDELQPAQNIVSQSGSGSDIISFVSSMRSNEYKNLREYLSERLCVHHDYDIEIINSVAVNSDKSLSRPHYPGMDRCVDVLSTIRVLFGRHSSEKSAQQKVAAVLLSYTVGEHTSMLNDGYCSIGNFIVMVPSAPGSVSRHSGVASSSWKSCAVSKYLATFCQMCLIYDARSIPNLENAVYNAYRYRRDVPALSEEFESSMSDVSVGDTLYDMIQTQAEAMASGRLVSGDGERLYENVDPRVGVYETRNGDASVYASPLGGIHANVTENFDPTASEGLYDNAHDLHMTPQSPMVDALRNALNEFHATKNGSLELKSTYDGVVPENYGMHYGDVREHNSQYEDLLFSDSSVYKKISEGHAKWSEVDTVYDNVIHAQSETLNAGTTGGMPGYVDAGNVMCSSAETFETLQGQTFGVPHMYAKCTTAPIASYTEIPRLPVSTGRVRRGLPIWVAKDSGVTVEFVKKIVSQERAMLTLSAEILLSAGMYENRAVKDAVRNALKSMAHLVTEGVIRSEDIKVLQHAVYYDTGAPGYNVSGVYRALARYGDADASADPNSANLEMSFSFVLVKEESVDFHFSDTHKGKGNAYVYSAENCVFRLSGIGKPLTELVPGISSPELTFPPRGLYPIYVPHAYLEGYDDNWQRITEVVLSNKGSLLNKIKVVLRVFWDVVCEVVKIACSAILCALSVIFCSSCCRAQSATEDRVKSTSSSDPTMSSPGSGKEVAGTLSNAVTSEGIPCETAVASVDTEVLCDDKEAPCSSLTAAVASCATSPSSDVTDTAIQSLISDMRSVHA